MEVKLDKRYPVAAGPEAAWAVLRDIRAVASCMPGAQITEQIDDTRYKGTVKSRVGPAVMSFGGDVELQAIEEPARLLRLLAKGADKSGSSASMQLNARIEPGDGPAVAVLAGQATIVVAGKLAQFGNRLLVPVADAMLQQFAENFSAAAQRGAATTAAATAVPTQAAADAAQAATLSAAPDASPSPAAAGISDPAASTAALASAPPRQQPPVPAPVQARELNALGLLWTVFKTWLKGLFRRKR